MATSLLAAEPKRLERAFDLLATRHISMLRPGVWRVESQTWPGATYLVREDSGCACPDRTMRGMQCKHELAMLLARTLRPGVAAGRIQLVGS
jgi:hypothetical protein